MTSIRAAAPADAAALAALLGELGYPATAEEVAARLTRLREPHDVVLVTLEEGGAVRGLLGLHRLTTLHAAAPACYITALVVAAAARGRGIGRALLDAAESWARRAGCSRIVVTSAEHRAAAHAFYERAGYQHTGRRFVRSLGAAPTGSGPPTPAS